MRGRLPSYTPSGRGSRYCSSAMLGSGSLGIGENEKWPPDAERKKSPDARPGLRRELEMSNEGIIWTDLSLFPSKAVAKNGISIGLRSGVALGGSRWCSDSSGFGNYYFVTIASCSLVHFGSCTGMDIGRQASISPSFASVLERSEGCDRIALILQGGGALGAYQAGVYQALHEGCIEPDWVTGDRSGGSIPRSLPETVRNSGW